MTTISDQTFDEERALYGSRGLLLNSCRFDGPADGESALKESGDITARDCYFNLRYPCWHVDGLRMESCELTPNCRAAMWYTHHAVVTESRLHGIKAFRECRDVALTRCEIVSPEFGWFLGDVLMEACEVESEYFMLRSRGLDFQRVTLHGKYSFQYVEHARLKHCELYTKDALWHCRDVVVSDSVLSGEYLAWFADGLTLERCKIIGTQPLCYCRNLTLRDCEMVDTDLAFEKSDVQATITTPVLSIKNPASGVIHVPSVGEVIMDDETARGRVVAAGAAYVRGTMYDVRLPNSRALRGGAEQEREECDKSHART